MEAQEYVERGKHLFIPQLSIDTVVIGFRDNQLKVLLLEFDGQWMLPGGHVYHHESVEEASKRILLERTGLAKYYLKLFHVFGDSDRSFPCEMKQIFEKIGMAWKEDIWINDRYVSIGYYALVDIEQAKPTGSSFTQKYAWHDLKSLPEMWFDHEKIVVKAHKTLEGDVSLHQHSFNLLPEKFTMPQLHQLHEQILDKKLDRSRFQKKMLSLDIFERLPELKEGVPYKRPYLYKFKRESRV